MREELSLYALQLQRIMSSPVARRSWHCRDRKNFRDEGPSATFGHDCLTADQLDSKVIDVLMSPGPEQIKDNPYLSLLFTEVGRCSVKISQFSRKSSLLKRHDIIHIHWPEWLVTWSTVWRASLDIATSLGLLWLARRRGAALVWTGHNLEPHELPRPWLWQIFQRLFLSQTDLLVSFGDGATKSLIVRYPQLAQIPVAIIPHGHYRDYYTARSDALSFREQVGLDHRSVFLCFGLIKPYKNIPSIVRAWKQLPVPRPQLVVAGRPAQPELEAAIKREAGGAKDIHLLLRFISDEDVPTLFAVADVLLVPYEARSTLNSGAAHLALSLGKPAVLNDTAANRELRKTFGHEWIYLCDGTPEDALRVAVEAAITFRTDSPDVGMIGYPQLAHQMREAYSDAMASRRTRR
jgi:beta-1,4-mannosyltransferase